MTTPANGLVWIRTTPISFRFSASPARGRQAGLTAFSTTATSWAGIEQAVQRLLWAMTLLLGFAFCQPARAQVSKDIQDRAAATGELTNPMTGTINCSTTRIVGVLTPGVPAEVKLEVVVDITTPGAAFFATRSMAFSRLTTPYLVSTTTMGIQTLSIPIHYDGSPLKQKATYHIRGLGSCPL